MTPTQDTPSDEEEYQYEHQTEETPIMAVISAVSDATDQSPIDMEPIADVIDPDAVDALIDTDPNTRSPVTITFPYQEYEIAVSSEEIRLTR